MGVAPARICLRLIALWLTQVRRVRPQNHARAHIRFSLHPDSSSSYQPLQSAFCYPFCSHISCGETQASFHTVRKDPQQPMMQSRNRAIQTLKSARTFTTSAPQAALSPYRTAASQATTKLARKNARPQSTAAQTAAPRARPSPAFNREDYNDVQPLRSSRQPEMDHSFVGMKGGEIFHEMMLRQGVKHICMFTEACWLPMV